ncbi:MAG: hypothetical protein JXA43_02035 [Candidatus Diapherotrites archaeon]|nr:hypothetical protein [Candidatus Diapherotrites archaeon]
MTSMARAVKHECGDTSVLITEEALFLLKSIKLVLGDRLSDFPDYEYLGGLTLRQDSFRDNMLWKESSHFAKEIEEENNLTLLINDKVIEALDKKGDCTASIIGGEFNAHAHLAVIGKSDFLNTVEFGIKSAREKNE